MSKQWRVITSVVCTVIVIDVMSVIGWFNVVQGLTLNALAQSPNATTQLEVRLIDDNGDGIPDRGVVDLPAGTALGSSSRPGRGEPVGRGFEPAPNRPFGRPFVPFFIVGGLIRGLISLAVLALLISLTVFFYRRWRPMPAVAPVYAPSLPVPLHPTVAAAPPESSEASESKNVG